LAEFLQRTEPIAREIPGVLLNVGLITGGSAANIVPDLAEAQMNIRATQMADGEAVLQRLRDAAAPINAREGFSLEIAGQFNRPPKEISAADEALFQAWQSTALAFGERLGWQDVGGGSDGNLLSAVGLPTLDGLGAVGGELHSPNEFVYLTSLVSRAQIAALFLHRLAIGEISPAVPNVANRTTR
jgi:glutamate carboxypeptidase